MFALNLQNQLSLFEFRIDNSVESLLQMKCSAVLKVTFDIVEVQL